MDRARILADIAEVADALCDPHPHVEIISGWDGNRNKKVRKFQRTDPGLLVQLREAAVYGSVKAESEKGGAGDAPSWPAPGDLDAISRLVTIEIGVVKWCWELRVELRDTAESNIRGIVGASASAPSDLQERILAEFRRWHSWASTLTGWTTPLYKPKVSCPHCGRVGLLRINLTRSTAFCGNVDQESDGEPVCGATWDVSTIGILAAHIRAETERVA